MFLMAFQGFSSAVLEFYKDLSMNNQKGWFEENKSLYQNEVIQSAKLFVEEMGDHLRSLVPNIKADTRTNGAGSIFRIYRDTRFSRDKSPYKTFLGILFWEGDGKKTDHSGFYFHIDPSNDLLMVGAGLYIFPKTVLEIYREAVADEKKGNALTEILNPIRALDHCEVGTTHYKKVPRGYPEDHPRADLLKYNGLWAGYQTAIPDEIYSADFIPWCFEICQKLLPLHQWLVSSLSV